VEPVTFAIVASAHASPLFKASSTADDDFALDHLVFRLKADRPRAVVGGFDRFKSAFSRIDRARVNPFMRKLFYRMVKKSAKTMRFDGESPAENATPWVAHLGEFCRGQPPPNARTKTGIV